MSDSGSALPPPPTPSNDPTVQSDQSNAKKHWWKRWWAIALGVFIVFVVIAGIVGSESDNGEDASDSTDVSTTAEEADTTAPDTTTELTEPELPETATVPATTPVPDTTVPSTTTTSPTTTSTTTTSPTTTTTLPPTTTSTVPPLPGFGSGVILVGVDVEPGIYVAQVPDASFGCYWERLTDLSGDFDAIITNENVNPGAQAIVELMATDEAFSSTRCGDWTIYLPPDEPTNTFGEGTWIVSQQIVPGRYRSSGPGPDDFGCYWERLNGVTGEFETILANANTDGPTIVDIAPSDFAFSSTRCGDWSLAE